MVQHTSQSRSHLKFLWSVLPLVVILSFAFAACGGATSPSSTQSSSSPSPASGTTSTVTIAEKTGTHDIYSFDPQTITVKAGSTVKWVNNSDENHLLASKTAGVFTASSIVHRSGSSDNTYQVVFNTPGTYSYTSTLVQRLGNQPEGMTSSAAGTITVTA
ncbi:MAG TPA: plastocyanin/azurin family copper-binding protein [Ktedonobacteraceae bacterium]|nr:plastocyanin/azurin family copper-binding protein [Ktedonobacteraceae bacterium]